MRAIAMLLGTLDLRGCAARTSTASARESRVLEKGGLYQKVIHIQPHTQGTACVGCRQRPIGRTIDDKRSAILCELAPPPPGRRSRNVSPYHQAESHRPWCPHGTSCTVRERIGKDHVDSAKVKRWCPYNEARCHFAPR